MTELLSCAHAKGAKTLNDFKFGTLFSRFPSDGATSRAKKRLNDAHEEGPRTASGDTESCSWRPRLVLSDTDTQVCMELSV